MSLILLLPFSDSESEQIDAEENRAKTQDNNPSDGGNFEQLLDDFVFLTTLVRLVCIYHSVCSPLQTLIGI